MSSLTGEDALRLTQPKPIKHNRQGCSSHIDYYVSERRKYSRIKPFNVKHRRSLPCLLDGIPLEDNRTSQEERHHEPLELPGVGCHCVRHNLRGRYGYIVVKCRALRLPFSRQLKQINCQVY